MWTSSPDYRPERCRTIVSPAAVVLWSFLFPPAFARPDCVEAAEDVRREIVELRRDYEARIAALESRLAALEGEGEAERDRLRAAALRAAEEASAPTEPDASSGQGERPRVALRKSLNRLNPEISLTANLLATASDTGREEFESQEFELDLQAALDPFSRTRVTLAVGEEGELEIEEAYVAYASLPGGFSLAAGKFRQSFGVLNRQHLHALPQIEYPRVLTTFFDEEGLGQTGIALEWLLARPWASANEITLQVTDGEAEAFGGEAFEQLTALVHVKNYWDVSEAAYFEWGLSGIVGETAQGGASRVWGSDLTYHWQPPRRAKQRELTWRTEALLSQRDDPYGRRRRAWGGYSYLEALVGRGLSLGLRLDRVEDPLDPKRRLWGMVPYLTWWQSEYVRLRAQFERLDDDTKTENRFVVQLTWAAGPHKHETY